ncbi:hypothetical protein DXG01_009629 [Tephrocybe rancida]|nr:hypothetical protein DXG01_009629 [Tephrocybe rancida]
MPSRNPALRTVSEWMFSTRSSRKPVLWLHGPSQALNSSVAKHIADKCAQRGELAGSFFFSSESAHPKQNSIMHLVPTLALQLAHSPVRGFQPGLLKALHEDPFVTCQPIPTQVERLLLEPLQGVNAPGPFLVVIDALDQCQGEENQREVLTQLARMVQEQQNPLRFIVTSTKAAHLHRAFHSPAFHAISGSAAIANPQIQAREALEIWQTTAIALLRRATESFGRRVALHPRAPWRRALNHFQLMPTSAGRVRMHPRGRARHLAYGRGAQVWGAERLVFSSGGEAIVNIAARASYYISPCCQRMSYRDLPGLRVSNSASVVNSSFSTSSFRGIGRNFTNKSPLPQHLRFYSLSRCSTRSLIFFPHIEDDVNIEVEGEDMEPGAED